MHSVNRFDALVLMVLMPILLIAVLSFEMCAMAMRRATLYCPIFANFPNERVLNRVKHLSCLNCPHVVDTYFCE